jgi:hypothetical protein
LVFYSFFLYRKHEIMQKQTTENAEQKPKLTIDGEK